MLNRSIDMRLETRKWQLFCHRRESTEICDWLLISRILLGLPETMISHWSLASSTLLWNELVVSVCLCDQRSRSTCICTLFIPSLHPSFFTPLPYPPSCKSATCPQGAATNTCYENYIHDLFVCRNAAEFVRLMGHLCVKVLHKICCMFWLILRNYSLSSRQFVSVTPTAYLLVFLWVY